MKSDTLNMCIDQVKGHNDTQSREETKPHRCIKEKSNAIYFIL